jgi:hypothetical protein
MDSREQKDSLRAELEASFDALEKSAEGRDAPPSAGSLKQEISDTWAAFDRDRATAAREAPEAARLRRQNEVTRVHHGLPLREFINTTRALDAEIRRNPEARAEYIRQQSDPGFLAADAQRRRQAVAKIYEGYTKAARIPAGIEARMAHHLANGAANPNDISGSLKLAHAMAVKELRRAR